MNNLDEKTKDRVDQLKKLYNNTKALTTASAFQNQRDYEDLMWKIIQDGRSLEALKRAFEEASDLLVEYKKQLERLASYLTIYDKTVKIQIAPKDCAYLRVEIVALNKQHAAYNKIEKAIITSKGDGLPVKNKIVKAN